MYSKLINILFLKIQGLQNQLFRYSFLWRFSFAVIVPLMYIFFIVFLANKAQYLHLTIILILLAFSSVPYFFLLIKFSEKFHALEDGLKIRHIFYERSMSWKDIIEYRDFFNIIVLMPLEIRKTIHIYFYRNIKKYEEFRKYLSRKSKQYEVNMMSRKRDRIFLIIDLGALSILLMIIIFSAIVILLRNNQFFDMRAFITGMASGILFVISSVSVWMVLNDLTVIARENTHIIAMIMSITLLIPMLIIAREPLSNDGIAFAGFLIAYLLGYLIGWGGMSAFFPSRESKNRNKTYKDKNHRKK